MSVGQREIERNREKEREKGEGDGRERVSKKGSQMGGMRKRRARERERW